MNKKKNWFIVDVSMHVASFVKMQVIFYCMFFAFFSYSVEGFLEKNKDTLYQDFKRLLYNRQVSDNASNDLSTALSHLLSHSSF